MTRSPHIPDLQRDLLAAAERLAAGGVRQPHIRRPLPRRALLVAASVGMVAAAVLLGFAVTGRPGDHGFDVAAAVYRATAPRAGVLHVVTESRNSIAGVQGTRVRTETWSDPTAHRTRRVMRAGTTVLEWVSERRRLLTWGSRASWVIHEIRFPRDSPFAANDPVAGLRAMYRHGQLHVAGRTTINGRAAWRLQSKPSSRHGGRRALFNALVDAHTFVPIQITSWSRVTRRNGRHSVKVGNVTRYLVYERLADTPDNRSHLSMDDHPGAKVVRQPVQIRPNGWRTVG